MTLVSSSRVEGVQRISPPLLPDCGSRRLIATQEQSVAKRPPLTTMTGMPVSDNLNIQTAGPRGPALLQDIWLIEKLAHFDREVIPERRMHAKRDRPAA